MPASSLITLPDAIDDTTGALVEPGGNAWRAVEAARVEAGGRLLILGAGAIGLLVAMMARARGVEVHLVGRREASIRFARSLGFEHVWQAGAIPGETFEGVVDASNSTDLPALSVDLVQPGGRVVWIGLSGEPSRVDSRRVVLKDVTVVGILSASPGLEGALGMFASGRVEPAPLVAGVVGLDEVEGVLGGDRHPAWGDAPKVHVDPRADRRSSATTRCAGSRITQCWRSQRWGRDATMTGTTKRRELTMAKGKSTSAAADAAAAAGVEDLEAGAELVDAAGDAARETVAMAAMGAADLTSGEDRLEAAAALGDLSDIAEGEAVADTIRGAATLEAAEETADVSALVAAVSADNLDRGMFLASLSGQLGVAANVVELMRMPVLAAFLDVKGQQLRGLAVNEIGRAMAAAALAEGMDALSNRLAAIGLSEIAEGISEGEAADALLDARDDAVAAGMQSAAAGVAELSAAQAGARATRQLAGAGMVMATQGAEEIGVAEGLAASAPAKTPAKPAAKGPAKGAAKAAAKPASKSSTAKSTAGKTRTSPRGTTRKK